MIRLSKSVIKNEEIEAISKVLSREFLGMGEEVKMFEQNLSTYLDNNVVCVSTGTAALQLGLEAIGLKENDEVLVQSLTYLASFQAISAVGAKPIACEICREDHTIDLSDARSKLTSNTKAIMPVHYSGNVGNLTEIYSFAKEHNLRVIEDAAHAFGTIYKEKKIGSFGDIICFSFDGIKNITSGEGGAVVSNDIKVVEYVKNARLLGVINDSENRYQNKRTWDFDVINQGWRYHMSNLMAAIGIEQLKKIDFFISKRQQLAIRYVQHLGRINLIDLIKIDYTQVVPHIFVVKIKNGKRDEIKKSLEKRGIQTGIHYKPNHLHTFYKQASLPVTEKIYTEILTLPLHPDLELSDIDFICNNLIDFLND